MKLGRVRLDGVDYFARNTGKTVELLEPEAWWKGAVVRVVPLDVLELLVPVRPTKIVCVGRNYRAHAKELGNEVPAEPLLFFKPPSAVLAAGGTVLLPPESARVEHEGELVAVLGQRLRRATPEQALAAVFGWTCANDVTARDLQKKDVQFTRGKGFDTFCPLGPWIETTAPTDETKIHVRVNRVERQHGRVGDMVFSVGVLLSYISQVMTLEPGDVVLTGTPEGVGPLAPGDRVEVEIEGVGTLEHGVAAETVTTR